MQLAKESEIGEFFCEGFIGELGPEHPRFMLLAEAPVRSGIAKNWIPFTGRAEKKEWNKFFEFLEMAREKSSPITSIFRSRPFLMKGKN